MKSGYMLFLVLSSAIWTGGIVSVAESAPASQQTSNESSARAAGDRPRDAEHAPASADGIRTGKNPHQRKNGAATKNLGRGRAELTRTNRPRQLPNDRDRLANTTDVRPQIPDNSGGSAQRGFVEGKGDKSGDLARRPILAPTGDPSSTRHRGLNPPIVAGSVKSTTSNTASINGTRINRRR